jgi:NitT/TauT family transport system substrate-binding protein
VRLCESRHVLALIGFACSFLAAGTSFAETKIVIGLPVSTYAPFVPVYAARDLGIFAKNGVNAEITAFRSGTVALEALAAGSVDMIDNSPVGVARGVQKGVKLKIVAASVLTLKGWHIMVPTDSPIKSVKDLEGKKVAITAAGGLTDFYLLWAAQNAGVKNVKAIPVGGAGLVPALKTKQTDAVVMHAPLGVALMMEKQGRSIFDIDKGVPPNAPDVWAARQDLIDKNPKVIEAALKSIYQAVEYMKSHKTESMALFKKYSGESDDKIIVWDQEEMLPTLPTSAQISKKTIENALALGKIGGLTDLPSADEVYTDRFASVSAK